MINEVCPHCEKPCVSNGRKLFLLPGTTAACRSCGEQVGVPAYGMVSIFPLLFAYLIMFDAPGGGMLVRLAVAGVLVGFVTYFQVYLLPLVAR